MNRFQDYANRLSGAILTYDWNPVEQLTEELLRCWEDGATVFLCGNGGSAANAIHIANDLLYGIGAGKKPGMRVEALPSNQAILTCLANDISYEDIYSEQLYVKAHSGDLLIALSGSGNSENIVRALLAGCDKEMSTFAILGYSGGRCLEIAQTPIHLPVDDMQISEDFQLIVGHMCMQALCEGSLP